MKAIIMAGGQGTRLQPFTHTIPKPLLPVGRKPILQIIIEQLHRFGFSDIAITTEYKSDLISAYFQDGKNFGVTIRYVVEEQRLGTAGGLGKLRDWLDEPALLINGDILTKTNFKQLYDYHLHHPDSFMTVAIRTQSFPIPFGVAEIKNGKLLHITEKPNLHLQILAGIYVISPAVLHYISGQDYLDITEVIQRIIAENKPISLYEITEYWKDIGSIEDFTEVTKEENNW
ncbi:MAG: sugar phosphate nucleotidyltransferase [bacterium]|nr:sugar phosphate nucleotidyltransferase [bacterium]